MIGPLSPKVMTAGTTAAAYAPAKEKDDKLVQAAQQMESVFVRELLKAAKVGGPKADSGYGSMATDALADAIEKGGGFGLAKRIQDAVNDSARSSEARVRSQNQDSARTHVASSAKPLTRSPEIPKGSPDASVPMGRTRKPAGSSHEE